MRLQGMRNEVNPLQKQINLIMIIPMKRVFLWKQLRKSHGIVLTHLKAISVFSSDTSEVPKIKLSVTKQGIQTHKETSLTLREHFKNAKDSMLSSYLFKRKFKDLNLQHVDIPGDGYCFLSSILIALGEKGVTKTFEQLSIEISEELHDNLHTYCEFLSDEEQNDMLLVAANFFQAGVYNTNVVDV